MRNAYARLPLGNFSLCLFLPDWTRKGPGYCLLRVFVFFFYLWNRFELTKCTTAYTFGSVWSRRVFPLFFFSPPKKCRGHCIYVPVAVLRVGGRHRLHTWTVVGFINRVYMFSEVFINYLDDLDPPFLSSIKKILVRFFLNMISNA